MHTADSIEARNSSEIDGEKSAENSERKSVPPAIAPYCFKPGQSGNPAGRPKRDHGAELARAVLESNPELYYQAFSKQLAKGNAYAFKELCDRGYGKMPQKTELTGKDGGPIETRDVADGDLSERIKQLERELGYASAIDEAGRVGSAEARAEAPAGAAKD